MTALNFKHLKYFWTVAKTGSIASAASQLHLTPHSISRQLSEFNASLGVELFRRSRRSLELTDAGRRILSYAEEIFAISDELLAALHDPKAIKTLPFRVGIADSVSKSVAYRLVEPALKLDEPVRLICREGRLAPLLAELAIHRLDMIIADRPMPANMNVRLQPPAGPERLNAIRHQAPGATAVRKLSRVPRQCPLPASGRRFHRATEAAQVAGEQKSAAAYRRRIRRQRPDEILRTRWRRRVCGAVGDRGACLRSVQGGKDRPHRIRPRAALCH